MGVGLSRRSSRVRFPLWAHFCLTYQPFGIFHLDGKSSKKGDIFQDDIFQADISLGDVFQDDIFLRDTFLGDIFHRYMPPGDVFFRIVIHEYSH